MSLLSTLLETHSSSSFNETVYSPPPLLVALDLRYLSIDNLLIMGTKFKNMPYEEKKMMGINGRKKIEKDPSNPQYIQTAFGKGYIFNKDKLI